MPRRTFSSPAGLIVAMLAMLAITSQGCGGAAASPDGGRGGTGGTPADGAATSGLTVEIRALAPPPIGSNGASISTAALWFQRIEIDGDQGSGSDQMRVQGVGFDAGSDLKVTLPSAPPGLYSLIRVTIAPADTGAGWPQGFEGKQLSACATGTVAGRTFEIDDDQGNSVDLHVTPATLAPGGSLTALIEVDVSSWLSALSLDTSGSGPIVVNHDDGSDALDLFTSNIQASLRGSLVTP
jgi:hypothetical protein